MKTNNTRRFRLISKEEFIKVCQSSGTMAEAAASIGLHFNTFKRYAVQFGCYRPNQAGIGIRKNMPKIPIEDIIEKSLHPHYQSYKLKKRLIEEGIKENKCEECGLKTWLGNPLPLELHHIDGKRSNHHLSNLMLLCPNCHSQTETFRARNRVF